MMELEDLKNTWAQYDKKLMENLKINEELLRRINLDKSKHELNQPMYGEMLAVVVTFLVFVSMMLYGFYMLKQPIFSILSFISAAIALTTMIFAIMKVKAYLKIDYYNTPVVQLQQQITSLKMFILKLRKIEFILAIPLVLSIFPALMKWVHNFDVFNTSHLLDPIIRIILIFGIGTPLAIWLNKHFYDKKIENAQYHLKEIEKFSREEE